jgi:hypothetical protein
MAAAQTWSEDFESRTLGPVAGQAGWSIWCTGGSDGTVEETGPAHSGVKSFVGITGTDVVQEFTGAEAGQWTFIAWVYVPSTTDGSGTFSGFLNLMNTYCVQPLANQYWSTATTFSLATGQVRGYNNSGVATLILDQWVEYRCEIDLDTDMFEEYYNGQLFVPARPWTSNVAPGGALRVQAIDVYSESLDGIRFDDLSFGSAGGCYPDCDTQTGIGVLDIFDFLCFGNRFTANDPYACDCDVSTGMGVCDIFDFLCFGNAFTAGCP